MPDMGFKLFKRKEKIMLKEIKKAFTLAEVLIVIGIIGVVAALTLPNLNHATGDKEKVTKVKKIYSALADAYGRAEAVYGAADTWFKDENNNNTTLGAEKTAKRISEFMKVSKECGFDEGCFSTAPLVSLTDSTDEPWYDNLEEMLATCHYMVTLSDGTSLAFRYNGSAGWEYIEIFVDIDGPNKGKNFYGDDIYAFYIGLSEDSIFAYNQVSPDLNLNNPASSPLMYNTYWVINYDNMDYLKCPDELDWQNGITSCK